LGVGGLGFHLRHWDGGLRVGEEKGDEDSVIQPPITVAVDCNVLSPQKLFHPLGDSHSTWFGVSSQCFRISFLFSHYFFVARYLSWLSIQS
jgi:hypothetical protein